MNSQQKSSSRATRVVEAQSLSSEDNISIKKPMTQCEMILEYMNTKGKINPIDALRDIGIFSLSQRISDLKRSGHNIISERVTTLGWRGNKINFAEYHLADNEVKDD